MIIEFTIFDTLKIALGLFVRKIAVVQSGNFKSCERSMSNDFHVIDTGLSVSMHY